jgi:hypothetical protein
MAVQGMQSFLFANPYQNVKAMVVKSDISEAYIYKL